MTPPRSVASPSAREYAADVRYDLDRHVRRMETRRRRGEFVGWEDEVERLLIIARALDAYATEQVAQARAEERQSVLAELEAQEHTCMDSC